MRIRRGLFANIPVGADPNLYPINPYLIAGQATPDAIIAYHSALSFYQVAYSISYRFLYLTCHQSTAFDFRSEHYQVAFYLLKNYVLDLLYMVQLVELIGGR